MCTLFSTPAMDTNEYVVFFEHDKQVFLAEIPSTGAPGSSPPMATFRLLVELAYHYGLNINADDVDIVEDVTCQVPLHELRGDHGAVDRAFAKLVANFDNPMLRLGVAKEAHKAAARVRTRYADPALGNVEFHIRVLFVDMFEEAGEEMDEEGECDFGSGYELGVGGWDNQGYDRFDVSDDEGDMGSQFLARPYGGASSQAGASGAAQLAGFEVRSDGPGLADQAELTRQDIRRLVRVALEGGSLEDDEIYRRAMLGGTPVSPATLTELFNQTLWSTGSRR